MRYEEFFWKNLKKGDKLYCFSPDFFKIDEHILDKQKIYQVKNMSLSTEQVNRVGFYNRLINTAIWLNNGWKPNWSDSEERKYFINYNTETNTYFADYTTTNVNCCAYFKTEELCQSAIEIMGEFYLDRLFNVLDYKIQK